MIGKLFFISDYLRLSVSYTTHVFISRWNWFHAGDVASFDIVPCTFTSQLTAASLKMIALLWGITREKYSKMHLSEQL